MPVFIRSAVRTPYGAFGGAFRRMHPEQLAAEAIAEVLRQAGIPGDRTGALILGQALRYGRGANPARQAALASGLGRSWAAWGVDQGSLSGLRAVIAGVQAITTGEYEFLICSGADSSSTAPYLLPAGRWGHRLGQSHALDPLLLDAAERQEVHQKAMEDHRSQAGIPQEAIQAWVEQSRRGARFPQGGCFPVTCPVGRGPAQLDADEYLLMAEPPALGPGWPLPPLADGAAALVLSLQRPLGSAIQIIDAQEAVADHPTGALLAATQELLARVGLRPRDLDQVEVDESLALSPLALRANLPGLDPLRINPRGGAFATGQAHGAEGVRLLVSLFHGLEDTGGRYGLATMETADGQGMALLLERTPA